MAPQSIVVERHLGVERLKRAVSKQRKRIDLNERGIVVNKHAIEPSEEIGSLLHSLAGKAQHLSKCQRGFVGQADARINGKLQKSFGLGLGDLFDVHPATAACHQANRLRDAINEHSGIELSCDVGRRFDIQTLDTLTLRSGLRRNQHLSQNVGSCRSNFFQGTGNFDAARLAAAARVNLSLDCPTAAADLLGRLHRLFDGKRRTPGGDRNPCRRKKRLGLILMNFHFYSGTGT